MISLEFPQDCVALFSIAHHIPGRIRLKLRISAARLREAGDILHAVERLGAALHTVPGIAGIHVNKLARSVTVEYDNRTIPDQAWPDLLANRPSPEATALLTCLREITSKSLNHPEP
ncbi:MAG: cation transporter [Zoogloeaceae bacterium]|nr:cation transporter [Zoogloeaceae bacterium]